MNEEADARLVALEVVVGELVRRVGSTSFRDELMATVDAGLGRAEGLPDELKARFVTFRRCVYELLNESIIGEPLRRVRPTTAPATDPAAPMTSPGSRLCSRSFVGRVETGHEDGLGGAHDATPRARARGATDERSAVTPLPPAPTIRPATARMETVMTEPKPERTLNEIADEFAKTALHLRSQIDAILKALADAEMPVTKPPSFDATPNAFRAKSEWASALSPEEEIARARQLLGEIGHDVRAVRGRLNQMLSSERAWRGQ